MGIIHAVVLGVVEGVTEFLPVSSTGHLILVTHLLGLSPSSFLKSFEIAIQLGAILAVLTLYGRMLWSKPALWARLAVAFAPTGVLGLALYPFIKGLLGSTQVVIWALAAGGVVLILFERLVPEPADAGEDISRMPYRTAFVVGLAQSVAMVPGVSRAAATICGGLAMGMSRRAIVEFSFLLALPTMAAATGYDLLKSAGSFTSSDFSLLAVGLVVSWLTAVFAIRWLLAFIRRRDFTVFGWYRIAAAAVFFFLAS